MPYEPQQIEDMLNTFGELIVVLDSDAYDENPELHLHDTSVLKSKGIIRLSLSDGTIRFPVDAIESVTYHEQSTADLGL
jgi:hypothetical protein